MTNSLILDSLKIRGFRLFRHLRIERLGRVNLIVGKNNVGKSSLLEALRLYARQASGALIWELLETRDEIRRTFDAEDSQSQVALAVKYLFHGRREINGEVEPIQIGPIDSQEDVLSITVGWYVVEIDEKGVRELKPLQIEEYEAVDHLIPALAIQKGTKPEVLSRLDVDRRFRRVFLKTPEQKDIPCIFVPANGLGTRELSELWDSISLTDLESDILDSLRIIAQEVDRVSLVGDQAGGRNRIPIVRIKGFSEPLPLRNLGEGMNRLFGIALALVNARDGLLLIDEIESGLHYSVQSNLWRLVFEVAHRLNMQVFATTHSWDCIEAFQEVAQVDKQAAGMLIRLENRKGEIIPILFDKDRLSIATREEIEVR